MAEERIVQKAEDIPWAIETLKQGDAVLCHPTWAQFLEYKTRLEGIEVIVQDDGFCYEFIPITENKGG